MSGINAGFAAYLAAKKAGKAPVSKPKLSNSKMSMALPPAVFNNVPGLPNIGKRHAKVMTAKKPIR